MRKLLNMLEEISQEAIIEIVDEIKKDDKVEVFNIAFGDALGELKLFDEILDVTSIVLNPKNFKRDLKFMIYCTLGAKKYIYEKTYNKKIKSITFEGVNVAYMLSTGEYLLKFKVGMK